MRNTFLNQASIGSIFDQIFNGPISEMVGADFYNSRPMANIVEEDENFRLELAAPGLEKSDFVITLEKNNLTISVQKVKEDTKVKGKMTKKEFNFDSFKRTFFLPENANAEAVSAIYTNGILQVNIAKKNPTQVVQKTIEIK
jgi:HSP20 family protein